MVGRGFLGVQNGCRIWGGEGSGCMNGERGGDERKIENEGREGEEEVELAGKVFMMGCLGDHKRVAWRKGDPYVEVISPHTCVCLPARICFV